MRPPAMALSVIDVLSTHDRWMSMDVLIDWVCALHPEWKPRSVRRAIWRLKTEGVIECRQVEHTFSDSLALPNKPYRMRTYRVSEFRADDEVWEAIGVA